MYSGNRANFHVFLFPYEEQQGLFDTLKWPAMQNIWANGNNADLTKVVMPGLLCPSDGFGGNTVQGDWQNVWARTNYFGVFTGMTAGDLNFPGRGTPYAHSQWAFFDGNRCTTMADIRDGLSNTMCIAESLTGPPAYIRGMLWSDQPCGAASLYAICPEHPAAGCLL